jgi:predicted Zn-dependent protease
MKALNNELFNKFSSDLFSSLKGDEELSLSFSGEKSLFARFSTAKVRQVTHVHQAAIEMKLIKCNKTISVSLPYSGDSALDLNNAQKKLNEARVFIEGISDDPYLVRPANYGNSLEENLPSLPSQEEMMNDVLRLAGEVDLAGLLSTGDMVRAASNSKGQSHWFKTRNYSLDYSLYNSRQKAVKSLYAGVSWNEGEMKKNLDEASFKLNLMNRDSRKVKRGNHRVYLAPSAVGELLHTLSWGGLSMGAHQKGQGSLKQLWEGKEQLSKKFTLKEDFTLGLSPRFNDAGEVAPNTLSIIEEGKLVNFLVSSRTANEYKLNTNFSNDWEMPRSPVVSTGNLSHEKILSELGTGLYISDLHYLNWSDRETARLTGMTRYACFWVENGEIVSPIEDLRFDESYYSLFGNALIDLTDFSEIIPSTGTYFERSIGGLKTPGILLSEFKFTL